MPGVSSFNDEDLLMWDGSTYTMVFDGSANGLSNDIDAVHLLDNGDIVFSTGGGVTPDTENFTALSSLETGKTMHPKGKDYRD